MTMKISTHEDVMVPVMAKSPLKPCSETLTEVTMLSGPLHVGSPTDHFRWMSNISPFSVRLITARETSATKGLPFGKTCSFSKDKLVHQLRKGMKLLLIYTTRGEWMKQFLIYIIEYSLVVNELG